MEWRDQAREFERVNRERNAAAERNSRELIQDLQQRRQAENAPNITASVAT
jgi:hypothetical protein